MKKATIIFFTCYYAFAIVVFPMCDFSLIADIPEMYKHCKETEDPSLTAFDFITEHLVDFDCFFEQEKETNNEKPHKQTYQHCQSINYVISTTVIQINNIAIFKNIVKHYCKNETNLYPTFHNNFLRPPIV